MHTHIAYGLSLMLAFGACTGMVGFSWGYATAGFLLGRKYRDREEMIVLARLHEISQGGPQLVA